MGFFYLLNVAMLAVVGWALWVRRDAWRSRWDAPMNVGIVLQAVATVLDSPWPLVLSWIEALVGREYVATVFAELCYLASGVLVILAVYKRLLSDQGIGRFMTTRVVRPVAFTAVTMLTAFVFSGAARVPTGEHLYLIPRDGWLYLYLAVYGFTILYLLIVVERGMTKLREQVPESFDVFYLIWARFGIAAVSTWLLGLVVDVSTTLRLAWPLAYLATAFMALGAGRSWRKRMRQQQAA